MTRYRPWWHRRRINKGDNRGIDWMHSMDQLYRDERGMVSWLHGIDCECCGGLPAPVDLDCAATADAECNSCAIPCSLEISLQGLVPCTCVFIGGAYPYVWPYNFEFFRTGDQALRFDVNHASGVNDYRDASEWCAVWRAPINDGPGDTHYKVELDTFATSSCITIGPTATTSGHAQIYLLNDLTLDVNIRQVFACNIPLSAGCASLASVIACDNESISCPAGPDGWVRNPLEFPTYYHDGRLTVTPHQNLAYP